jgi:hypothetical protein
LSVPAIPDAPYSELTQNAGWHNDAHPDALDPSGENHGTTNGYWEYNGKRIQLVGGLEQEFYFFHSVGNVIIPTVTHSIIFQRGWLKPPTNQEWGYVMGI